MIAGIGIGGTSALLPTYQSECAPRQIRGLLVAAYQWNIAFGQFIAAIAVNGTKDINGPACYRIPIAIQLIWGTIILVGFLIFPESPRWLITKGREEEAQRSLARIFACEVDSPRVSEEYAEIAANLHHERSLGKASFLDCFRNDESRTGFRMWTGIGVQAGGQLAGINFILYYGTTFFTNGELMVARRCSGLVLSCAGTDDPSLAPRFAPPRSSPPPQLVSRTPSRPLSPSTSSTSDSPPSECSSPTASAAVAS